MILIFENPFIVTWSIMHKFVTFYAFIPIKIPIYCQELINLMAS